MPEPPLPPDLESELTLVAPPPPFPVLLDADEPSELESTIPPAPPAPYVRLVPDILLVNPAPPVSQTSAIELLLPPAVVLPPPPPPFSPPTLFPAPFPPVGAVNAVAADPPNPGLPFALRLL